MVPEVGLEPTRGISPADFESATSANSIIPANLMFQKRFLGNRRSIWRSILENRSYSFFKKPYFTGFFGTRTAESEYDFESLVFWGNQHQKRSFGGHQRSSKSPIKSDKNGSKRQKYPWRLPLRVFLEKVFCRRIWRANGGHKAFFISR